jgi:transposase
MDEQEALKQLSQDELIEIILELRAEIEQLKEQINRPPKTPKNSSTPSGQSRKANRRKKRGAKRGPKPGHPGTSRRNVTPDVIVDYRVGHCSDCGADLSAAKQEVIGTSQVVDIPPIRPVVTEARRHGVCCPVCGSRQDAHYPETMRATRVLGPRLEAFIHYLHMSHPLSYQRVQRILQDLFGLMISKGALVNVVKRGSVAFAAQAQAILQEIREREIIGSDETGARVDGENQWLWVVQTRDSAYFTIAPRRSGTTLTEIMEGRKPLVWISDLFSAQLTQQAIFRQICLPHQARDLQYAVDMHRCAWAYRLRALFQRAMRLGKQRDAIPPHEYGKQTRAIEHACDALLAQVPASAESQRLLKRFRKHRQHLFTFFYIPSVPATNNASEQALRNAVIYRKATGGFRSDWGAAAYAHFASVIETARRRGQVVSQAIQALLASPLDLSIAFST